MITLEVGLEIRHRGVVRVCAIEDKTAAVVVAASCRSLSRNPVRFRALGKANYQYSDQLFPSKATSHLTISMRGQRATGKIQRNNYHHGSCAFFKG